LSSLRNLIFIWAVTLSGVAVPSSLYFVGNCGHVLQTLGKQLHKVWKTEGLHADATDAELDWMVQRKAELHLVSVALADLTVDHATIERGVDDPSFAFELNTFRFEEDTTQDPRPLLVDEDTIQDPRQRRVHGYFGDLTKFPRPENWKTVLQILEMQWDLYAVQLAYLDAVTEDFGKPGPLPMVVRRSGHSNLWSSVLTEPNFYLRKVIANDIEHSASLPPVGDDELWHLTERALVATFAPDIPEGIRALIDWDLHFFTANALPPPRLFREMIDIL
jgi:hypothetical protein